MMTLAEHRKLVEERRKRSRLWQVIHLLGSLHLAVILLAVIAIACAVATLVESGFSARAAHAHIYRAPWFTAWLALLIINLFAVTLTRWPWLPKHRGFVITHYGIIILLIGAHAGATAGFEASVTLDKGKPADRLVGRQTVLFLQTLDTQEIIPFDPEAARPSEKRPRVFQMRGAPVKVIVDRYAPALLKAETIEPAPDPNAPPGLLLRLQSARMGQTIEMPLLAAAGKDSGDLAGLASVRLVDGLPSAAAPGSGPWKEMHVALAAAPGAPVSNTLEGEPSGILPVLEPSGDSLLLHLQFPDNTRLSYRLSEVLGKTFNARWATVEVLDYWPDFEMRDGRPATRSDQPNNPAVMLRLSGASNPVPPAATTRARPELLLDAKTIPSGRIAYRLTRGGLTTGEGALAPGEPLATGWADWAATITTAAPRARVRAEWRETDPARVARGEAAPGIRARLVSTAPGSDNESGEPAWIGSGSHVFLSDGSLVIRAGFGHRLIPIDFKVTLEKFEVPRMPGTDRPANFVSTVRFDDPRRGLSQVSTIRMNHPASFPPGLWGQISGRTLKFSQAQWNPENLDETTLQVLYDPGWLLKWIGSLMICAGIAIMFYFKPRRAAAPAPAPGPAAADTPAPPPSAPVERPAVTEPAAAAAPPQTA